MELTDTFLDLLQNFVPVFTAPTYNTFVFIVTGWILSQRHRYVTELIFSSGHVGDGHWSRFHRFFSHAAWNVDTFSMYLAKLVVTILAPARLFSGRLTTPSAGNVGSPSTASACTTIRSFPVSPRLWSVGDTTGWCSV